MSPHSLFYCPYASFANEQLPLIKIAALYFDKLIILDPVGASWARVGSDHVARDAISLLKDVGILEVVTPADVLVKCSGALMVSCDDGKGACAPDSGCSFACDVFALLRGSAEMQVPLTQWRSYK